jgi:hypothetical protein
MARQIHPLAPHLLHNHTCRRENGKIRWTQEKKWI